MDPDVNTVSPVPLIVPPFQFNAPLTVRLPLPVSVPARMFSCDNESAVLMVVVPPLTVRIDMASADPKLVVPALAIAPMATVPPKFVAPLVCTFPKPVMSLVLWKVCAPLSSNAPV